MLEGVDVPEPIRPIFEKAQEHVRAYFEGLSRRPGQGTIEIQGQRYILIRAASMSVEFFEILTQLFQEHGADEAVAITRNLLFDVAHAIGMADARTFHRRLDLKDPIEKLSAGPLHFAHSGWATVDILPESRPAPNESYYLIYNHPYSFEADSWVRAGKQAEFPVCVMNAGYSSGWCQESFGVPLLATEILCRARGDETCRFIMTTPQRIQEAVQRYLQSSPKIHSERIHRDIAGYFSRREERDRRIEAERQRERLIRELEAKNAELERFAYTVSHDLKSPLITINGFLGMMEDEIRSGETSQALEDLTRIRNATEKMELLLNELLELSRIGRRMNEPTECNMETLAREAVELAAGRIAQRGVEVEISPHLSTLIGDRIRLLEVLQNLVDNAVKFMGDQPKPRIRIGSRRKGEETIFFVEDNGRGLDERDHDRIFGLFEKLEADSQGSGLGLTLVQRIVVAHGGRIWVESDGPGKGATFCFTVGNPADV